MNLVKLKGIHLYTGSMTDSGVKACEEAVKLLRDADVKYTELNYGSHSESHEATFAALNTWVLGSDNHKKITTDFPILTWDECFDDYSVYRRIAHGLVEIEESDVLKYPELTAK